MSKDCPWLFADWPTGAKRPIHHLFAEDLRRLMWVKTIGRFANAAGCEREGREEGHLDRFADHWANWMLPYDSALSITWTNAALKNPYYLPGSTIVWFEDSFSSVISGVDFSVDPKGEFIVPNCTLRSGVYTIYNSNTQSGGHITPTIAPNWYVEFDNWRPGTPLMEDAYDLVVRVRRNTSSFSALTAKEYIGAVNADEIWGHPIHTVRCNYWKAQMRRAGSVNYFEEQLEFQFRYDLSPEGTYLGWWRKFPDMGFRTKASGQTVGTEILDESGQPISNPVLLDGSGGVLGEGLPPVYRYFLTKKIKTFSTVFNF